MTACEATGGLISVEQGDAILNSLLLTDSVSQAIVAQGANLTLEECLFSQISTQRKTGVLECFECGCIYVSGCIFQYITARLVAGAYVNAINFTVETSAFQSLRAESTGALHITVSDFHLSDSYFSNNSATGQFSSGGALQLTGLHGSIVGTNFLNNSAWAGGAIRWLSGKLELQECKFENNIAGYYGPSVASFASHLWTPRSFLKLAGGRNFEDVFNVYLQDDWNQTVLTDSETQAWLWSNGELNGKVRTVAFAGQLAFSGFTVTGSPGSTVSITIQTEILALGFNFTLKTCERGEYEQSRTCLPCPSGTYSLALNASSCKLCPEGAKCPGSDKLRSMANYWRPHADYEGVFSCPLPGSCLGQGEDSLVDSCAQLYTGRLCQSCKNGAFRRGRDRCVACPNDTALLLQAVLLSLWFAVLQLQVWASSRAHLRLGVLLRILVDYLQITALVTDFEQNWPGPLRAFFLLHLYLGNAVQIFLPVDCLYSDTFLITTVVTSTLPLIIATFFVVFWTFVWVFLKIMRVSTSIEA